MYVYVYIYTYLYIRVYMDQTWSTWFASYSTILQLAGKGSHLFITESTSSFLAWNSWHDQTQKSFSSQAWMKRNCWKNHGKPNFSILSQTYCQIFNNNQYSSNTAKTHLGFSLKHFESTATFLSPWWSWSHAFYKADLSYNICVTENDRLTSGL